MHLPAHHRGAGRRLLCQGFHLVVAFFDAAERLVGFFLHACKYANELHPFRLSQWIEFLVTEMWNQRDTCLLDGLIAAAFEWRDKDNIWIGSYDNLWVEVSLHANLHDATVFHTLFYVLIIKVLGAGNALYEVQGIHCNKVG